jgi:hypothetical protein
VTTDSDGVLQTISAKPSDKTATIVGNVFSSAAKILPLALGVPTSLEQTKGPLDCGEATQIKAEIDQLRAKLRKSDTDDKQIAGISASISRLRDLITVTSKARFEPGADSPDVPPPEPTKPLGPDNPLIFRDIYPSRAAVGKAKWYNAAALDQAFPPDGSVGVNILDYRVQLAILQGVVPKLENTQILPATYYRDPLELSIPVVRFEGRVDGKVQSESDVQRFKFAQLGTPRTLPVTAQLFESLDWSFTFGPDGVLQKSSFANTARGTAASSLLSGAAANAAEASKTVSAAETVRLTNETKRINAEIDLIQARKKLRDLEEQLGQSP